MARGNGARCERNEQLRNEEDEALALLHTNCFSSKSVMGWPATRARVLG